MFFIYKFVITNFKIFENLNTKLFKNESKLKDLLLKDSYFAKGDVHQAIINIIHQFWTTEIDYSQILNYTEENFGKLPLLALYFGKYNYQVGNGGHAQYFGNGYASSNSSGFSSNYDDISKHEEFLELFKNMGMIEILPLGATAYSIIDDFELDLDDDTEDCSNCNGNGDEDCPTCDGKGEVDCEDCGGIGEDSEGVECDSCGGSGEIECEECEGKGHETCRDCDGSGIYETGTVSPNTTEWDKLDDRWYKIDDDIMEQFNDYLKSLTLDGEKMTDLIELAEQTQKYNL